MRRWREPLVLLVLFGVFTAWWLWPLPLVWRDHSAFSGEPQETALADFYLVTWVLAWDAHAVLTQPWALFQANTFFPSPSSLAYSEHLLGYLPLFAPTYWLAGNPILAVNVLVFLTYPLCAVATYALARRFTVAPAAALAGLLYAFAPFRYALPPHVHMLGTFWLPLALLGTERWLGAATPRKRDAALVALAVAMQGLSSVYLAYAMLVAYGVYLPLALVRWRHRLDARRLTGLAAALLCSAVAIGLPMLPYLELRRWGLIPSYDDAESARPALGLLFAGLQVVDYLRSTGIGIAGYGLGALALLPPWRGRAYGCAVGLALVLAGLLLACGPGSVLSAVDTGVPYRALVAWVPGFSAVRIASRFVVIAHLGFALLAGIGIGRLLARLRPAAGWTMVVAATLLFAWASSRTLAPLTVAREVAGGDVPEVYRWLGEHGSDRAVLEVPPAKRFPRTAHRMLMSTHHWLPIVEGYSGYPPPSMQRIYLLASELPGERALQKLVDHVDVGWVVVHVDELSEQERSRWAAPAPGLALVGRFGDTLLFDVKQKPGPGDRRKRFFSKTETLEGTPLAPLASCPGRLVLTQPLPEVVALGQNLVAHLEVHNDGAAPLPALGMYPRHLVMMHVQTIEAEHPGKPLRQERSRLINDVPAHRMIPAMAQVPLPAATGSYVVRFALVQVSDGPLARCGFTTIDVPIRVVPPPPPDTKAATS